MSENTPTGGEALLRELALRLSTVPGDPRLGEAEPQLFVGQLPPNLSLEIPLPEGSRLLGTLIRSEDQLDIVLDCTQSPEEVLNFYKERLSSAGWQEQEAMRPHHAGFVHAGFPPFLNHIVFCLGSQDLALTVNAYARKDGRTDVRLDLNASREYSPCARQYRRPHRMLDDLVPMLAPPPGARQQGGGGGGGPDNWFSSAMLETDMDLLALAAHYAAQLEKGGWTRSAAGHDGPLAWSTWTFRDEEKEPWRGLFFILKVPGREGQYALEVRIDWDKEDRGGGMRVVRRGGGWFSYTSLG